MTNRERAQKAEEALNVFTTSTYGGRMFSELHDEDKETAIYDLICDLLHAGRAHGHEDYQHLLYMGRYHYEAELDFGWDEDE